MYFLALAQTLGQGIRVMPSLSDESGNRWAATHIGESDLRDSDGAILQTLPARITVTGDMNGFRADCAVATKQRLEIDLAHALQRQKNTAKDVRIGQEEKDERLSAINEEVLRLKEEIETQTEIASSRHTLTWDLPPTMHGLSEIVVCPS